MSKKNCPKVAFIKNIPTVYNMPVLEKLCDDDRWDMYVYFCGLSHADRYWEFQIDHPKISVLGGWASRPRGPQWFTNHLNPGIVWEILKNNFDVIVVGGYAVMTFQIAIILARILGIPYAINTEIHSEFSSEKSLRSKVKQLLKHKICRESPAFLATGSRVKTYLSSLGVPLERIFVFPNTCDVKWFGRQAEMARKNRIQLCKKYGLESNYIILYVGRFVDVKNVESLIDSYSLLTADVRANTSLALVGDGELRSVLEQKAKTLGLNNVRFLGHHNPERLSELYGISDLFVLLSNFEPWGVVVNEAAASGLPLIVGQNIGAGYDIVRDGENGYIVDSMNHRETARCIEKILLDQNLARSMGECSLKIVQDWTYERCLYGFSEMIEYTLSPMSKTK